MIRTVRRDAEEQLPERFVRLFNLIKQQQRESQFFGMPLVQTSWLSRSGGVAAFRTDT